MGFLSKLGSLDPLGQKLHKLDPLGKYDPAGTVIYGSGAAGSAPAGGGQPSYGVSGWNPEMQALHDYYARSTEQGGLGASGQQAVGWNPGMMSQGQIMDQYGSGFGQNMGNWPQPTGWRDMYLSANMQGGSGQNASTYGNIQNPTDGRMGGYGEGQRRAPGYPTNWGGQWDRQYLR